MSKSIHKQIDEQVKRWEKEKLEEKSIDQSTRVITISRESGSQGYEVAKLLCQQTGFDLFHNEILDKMVEISKNNRALLKALDERSMNIVDDIVSNFVNDHHLWPDEYSKLLLEILTTIGKYGNAVILGRGANCVLHHHQSLRVRIVAPLELRINFIQHSRDLNKDDAQKYMISMDANRAAFVKRYFNSDVNDASNYDLILNTGTFSVERAVQIIKRAIS